uniref:Uncharacterized protein n=1 Tax=Octopus bimaculoides TaxID=37653 RepID=A0A0L8GSM1_OCTBM
MENISCMKLMGETKEGQKNRLSLYRQRSVATGGVESHNGKTNNNKWVAPYNETLLRAFKCHCNVEIIASVRSVKYIIKYTLKGNDQAAAPINNDNEISQYLMDRYIGPSEVVASILGF